MLSVNSSLTGPISQKYMRFTRIFFENEALSLYTQFSFRSDCYLYPFKTRTAQPQTTEEKTLRCNTVYSYKVTYIEVAEKKTVNEC